MARHRLCVDTANELSQRKAATLTWRELAVSLGYQPSYAAALSAAARRIPGAMSRDAETDLRQRLGLPVSRPAYKSIALPADLYDRLSARRRSLGLTWAELLSAVEHLQCQP